MDQFQFQMCLVTTDDIKISYMSKLYNHYNLLYIIVCTFIYIMFDSKYARKKLLKNTLLDDLYVYLL